MLNSLMESSLLENDEFQHQRMATMGSSSSSSSSATNNNHGGTANPVTNSASTRSSYYYPVVEVVAPETLNEGYTFDVEVNHEILSVVVPHGGVKKGQTFRGQTQAQIQNDRSVLRIPVGGWKDGLFDFCQYGPFHPSLLCATCCPFVALGQIYTRLNLNWYGEPNNTPTSSSHAFKIMVVLTVAWGFVPNNHFFNILFFLLCGIFIGKTRNYIRNRYEIPAMFSEEAMERAGCRRYVDDSSGVPLGCDVVEDFCVSCVCAPCSVSQMSRHTAPYDTYEGVCFSSDGMPPHAPVMF